MFKYQAVTVRFIPSGLLHTVFVCWEFSHEALCAVSSGALQERVQFTEGGQEGVAVNQAL